VIVARVISRRVTPAGYNHSKHDGAVVRWATRSTTTLSKRTAKGIVPAAHGGFSDSSVRFGAVMFSTRESARENGGRNAQP
jgi:hypothetical protein